MSVLSRTQQALFSRGRETEKKAGFGTFLGVFVPTILMLFGVIIFLRLGWIVGQGGLSTALMIITFATLIVLVTTLSLAAIATNTEVGKGGVYYILSRSLGIEVGSAIGLPLYLKQTLSIAFCIVGFAESLHDLVPTWSITTIGIWSLITLTVLAYTSLKGALKVQVIIFITLIASLISLFTGGELTPAHPDTFIPKVPQALSFWAIFAIFFPAMTGIESSVSLSGDLRNPSKSVPLGTIAAVLVAYVIYISIPIFLVQHVSTERLANDPLVMQDVARFASLIVLGIWGATLSSALGGLLGAPRTLQALAEDGVVPGILGKTVGSSDAPKIATLVTFVIALAGVYFGTINMIAPLLTMICLICYSVLNLSAGFEALMENPSWRPRFRIHWFISIFGALLCLFAMLMIDVGTAITSLCFIGVIYTIAKRRRLNSSWDDLRLGILMFFSRFAIYRLAYATGSSRSWRPHFLVFTEKPDEQSNNLVRFSQAISQSKSFLTMASFLPLPHNSEQERRRLGKMLVQRLQQNNIQAFVQINHADKVTSGMYRMIQNYGLGPLVPNTIVFGGVSREEELIEFTRVVQAAYQRDCNVVILNDKNPAQNLSFVDRPLGDIHIWWDENHQANAEFMLVLAYMLQRNPAWQKAQICIKAVVPNEILRQQKVEDFKALGIKKRLHFNIEVLVSPNPEEELLELIKVFSKDAGLIFLSLRPPKFDESLEDYTAYLQMMPHSSTDFPPTALVLSSEHTPSEKILN